MEGETLFSFLVPISAFDGSGFHLSPTNRRVGLVDFRF